MSQAAVLRPAVMGPLGPAELTCIRSWGGRGFAPLFIQLGERRAHALLQQSLAGYLHVPESTDDAGRIALIRGFLETHDASGLTCLPYNLMEWLHRNPDAVPAQLPLWIASLQLLPLLQSKRRQQQVAAEVGLSVLESFFFDKNFDGAIEQRHFPLVLRPGDDSEVAPHFKMTLVKDVTELEGFLDSRTRLGSPLIGQRFVNGPNLVVHGARSASGQHLNLAGFMATRKFAGVTLTIEPVTLPKDIKAACQSFVDKIDYVGVYHFELLFDPESCRYYFLEINGRLGGTTAKVFACGYDEPVNMVVAHGGIRNPSNPPHASATKGIVTNKRAVFRALWETARRKRTLFDYAASQSIGYPLDLMAGLLAWRDEIFLPGHLKTGFAYTLHASLPAKLTPEGDRSIPSPKNRLTYARVRLLGVLRAVLGPYQVFHIFSYTKSDAREHECDSESLTLVCTQQATGYRFAMQCAEDASKEVCGCSFWTSETSNEMRNFIPLQPRDAELVFLETDPAYRGRGLAKVLVMRASSKMTDDGFQHLYARIWHSNTASLRTFAGAGWKYAYTMAEFYPVGRTLRLRLRLPKRLAYQHRR